MTSNNHIHHERSTVPLVDASLVEIAKRRTTLVTRLVVAVWIAVTCYAILYWLLNAKFLSLVMFIGVATLFPAMLLLETNKRQDESRLLFLTTANFYIYIASLCLKHQVNAEYYYLSAGVLALMIAGPQEKKIRAFGLALPMTLWTATELFGYEFAPPWWFGRNMPYREIAMANFLGAFAISMAFVRIYFESIFYLQQLVVQQVEEKRAVLEKANRMLRRKTRSLRESQRIAKLGHWNFQVATKKMSWSAQMFEIFPARRSEGEPSFEDHLETIHPEDRDHWNQMIDLCIRDGTPLNMRYRVLHPDGKIVWVQVNGKCVRENGIVVRLFGTCQDITHHAELEHELLQTRNFLQTTLDHMPGPVYAKTKSGKYIFANSVYYKLISKNNDPVIGKTDFDIFDRETAQGFRAQDLDVLSKKKPVHFEEKVPDGKGGHAYFDTYKFPLLDGGGEAFAVAGISIDCTDRKKIEIELEQQTQLAHHNAKLATIGELAAGVGHEINNPLAIADGNIHRISSLLKEQGEFDPRIRNSIDKYKMASKRIANIVHGLRTFARSDTNHMGPLNLNQVLDQTICLVQDIYHQEGIRLSFHVPKDDCYIVGNVGRIQQVFMNLLSNAKDALEGRPVKKIDVHLNATDLIVEVRVVDTGSGIPPTLREKIYDAFFTTKEVGKGTGIGLSLTQSIIREHKGQIDFESSPAGTTFILTFPRAQAVVRTAEVKVVTPNPNRFQKVSRALVVDDEEGLREILGDLLRERNCLVDEAMNGYEALSLMKNNSYDIVLTDLKMPEMDGPALLRKIHEGRGQRPVLVAITGGVATDFSASDRNELSGLLDGYILKPFEESELDKVLELVNQRQNGGKAV